MVNRLKTRYGFPRSVDAQYLGALNQPDTSFFYAALAAKTLSSMGINVNFAPVVDVNINPQCPVIGKIKRSFSADPERVAQEAAIVYKAQQQHDIISVYKHFPGHGSALGDSHLGFTDVSLTWKESELLPYKALLGLGLCDAVMSAHVFNSRFDTLWPASLSSQTINGLLREQIGWQGVVFSDDMMMGAITDNFGFEVAIKQALLAGVDVLVFSNNIKTYDPAIASKAVACIKKLVNEGQIPWSVVTNSYLRILKLKTQYHLL
jgi:beta-N-acetylhexosaminidase